MQLDESRSEKLPLKSLKSERPASASKLSEAEAGSEFTSSGTWTLAGTGCKKTSAPTRRSSPSQQHRLKNRVKMLALSGTHHTLQKRPAAVIDSCWAFLGISRPQQAMQAVLLAIAELATLPSMFVLQLLPCTK